MIALHARRRCGRWAVFLLAGLLASVGALVAQTPDPAPPVPNTQLPIEMLPAAPTAPERAVPSERPVVAGWDNGFFLRSEDKKNTLRITGQIQTDYRAFLNGGDITDVDTFLVRRARLGIEATVAEFYEFRLLPDFGQGQARILDAYVNVRYWEAVQFEAGKFKQPFSYEELIQDRFVPTLERSIIDQLVPAREVGMMVHGQKLLADRLDYGVAISTGVPNGDTDSNDGKDFSWRVVTRPFNADGFGPWLHELQFGISMTTGFDQEVPNPNPLRTPATVPWLTFRSTVRQDGWRNRWSPELSWFMGPLGFATQYFYETEQFRATPAAARRDVPINGYYVLLTLLLTGEERTTYSQPITPLRPFDARCPLHAPGAWELVARTSRLRLSSTIFTPGVNNQLVDPANNSSGATELTIGFNWYLNRWVRMQFNWEHDWFDQPVRLGPSPAGLLSSQNTLLTRFQVIF